MATLEVFRENAVDPISKRTLLVIYAEMYIALFITCNKIDWPESHSTALADKNQQLLQLQMIYARERNKSAWRIVSFQF